MSKPSVMLLLSAALFALYFVSTRQASAATLNGAAGPGSGAGGGGGGGGAVGALGAALASDVASFAPLAFEGTAPLPASTGIIGAGAGVKGSPAQTPALVPSAPRVPTSTAPAPVSGGGGGRLDRPRTLLK